MLPCVDTHCHVDFDVFTGKEAELLDMYRQSGVTRIVMPATQAELWPRLQQLSQNFEQLVYAVGYHPWFLTHADCYEALETWLHKGDAKCMALGETGLDRASETSFAVQTAAFRQHLECAAHFQKPLIIHSVKAHSDVLKLLKEHCLPARGVIHGFTGSFEQALEFWKLGFLIGAGHVLISQKSPKTLDAIRRLPPEALLLETDAPQKTMQTPVDVVSGFQTIFTNLCELRSEEPPVLAQMLTQNAKNLFVL